jgi:hypothetical protein
MIKMKRMMMKRKRMKKTCKRKMLKWRVMILKKSQLNNSK